MRAALMSIGVVLFVVSVFVGFLTASVPLIVMFSLAGLTLALICIAVARIMGDVKRLEQRLDAIAPERRGEVVEEQR